MALTIKSRLRILSIRKERGKIRNLLEGIRQSHQRRRGEEHGNRERIAKALRFASTHTDTDVQEVALADYISRMKPEQEKIYYVTAENLPRPRFQRI
jgi:HSP90 family molecular chaperone